MQVHVILYKTPCISFMLHMIYFIYLIVAKELFKTAYKKTRAK